MLSKESEQNSEDLPFPSEEQQDLLDSSSPVEKRPPKISKFQQPPDPMNVVREAQYRLRLTTEQLRLGRGVDASALAELSDDIRADESRLLEVMKQKALAKKLREEAGPIRVGRPSKNSKPKQE